MTYTADFSEYREQFPQLTNQTITVDTGLGDHIAGQTVDEIVDDPTCEGVGHIAHVTNCAVCGEEISRTTEDVAALGHDWDPDSVEYVWADDNSSVKATIHCRRDNSHTIVETVQTTASEDTATCDEGGEITYTASFSSEYFTTQTASTETDALGHDWDISYEWSNLDNEQICFATAVCSRCGETEEERSWGEMTSEDPEATCTTDGKATYTAIFDSDIFTEQTITVDVPAFGHEWDTDSIEYEWTDDHSSVTATIHCLFDENHTQTETARTTETVIEEPGCTEEGITEYTATFTNEIFGTVTEEFSVPATGHDWEIEYYWEDREGDWICYASSFCNNCEEFDEEQGTITRTVTKEPTCEEAGSATYTATFENELYETQTKTVELEPLEHEWDNDNIEYVWTDDNSQVTATVHCLNDNSHVLTETVDTVEDIINDPTCETTGAAVYTATFEHEDIFESQGKQVSLPATGHDYEITYRWDETDNGIFCYAEGICRNNPDHIISESAAPEEQLVREASCDQEGLITYTATFNNSLFETQTKDEVLPKTEHSPDEWVSENEVASTCTEHGSRDRVTYCKICGEEISRETEELDLLMHDFGMIGDSGLVIPEDYSELTCSMCGIHAVTLDIEETDNGAFFTVTFNKDFLYVSGIDAFPTHISYYCVVHVDDIENVFDSEPTHPYAINEIDGAFTNEDEISYIYIETMDAGDNGAETILPGDEYVAVVVMVADPTDENPEALYYYHIISNRYTVQNTYEIK